MNSLIKRALCALTLGLVLSGAAFLLKSCTVSYTLSGASISPLAETVSVAYFPNNAPMVAPMLSSTFTEELKDKFSRQTKLTFTEEQGDLSFEGEIINYYSAPSSIASTGDGDAGAVMNRLTIEVNVRFVNKIEPQYNFERRFRQYSDYESHIMLQEAEQTLIPEIVEMLIDDIFNAAVSNW